MVLLIGAIVTYGIVALLVGIAAIVYLINGTGSSPVPADGDAIRLLNRRRRSFVRRDVAPGTPAAGLR
jgi:hypothetical protein